MEQTKKYLFSIKIVIRSPAVLSFELSKETPKQTPTLLVLSLNVFAMMVAARVKRIHGTEIETLDGATDDARNETRTLMYVREQDVICQQWERIFSTESLRLLHVSSINMIT